MARFVTTYRALAAELGCTKRAVELAEQAGRISKEPDGRWNVAKVRRQWAENTDHTKRSHGNPRLGVGGSKANGAGREGNGTATGAWNQARAVREATHARLLGLKLQKELGEVVAVEDVKRRAFAAARRARDMIQALPGRVAPIVAGLPPAEARKVLEEEVDRICDELAKYARTAEGPEQ